MTEPDFDKTVFVIMPFGEEGTKDREQNDDTYENIIKVAVESSGLDLTCIRSDEICLPGGVMEDVITYTVKSKYVIADLSDGNQNVFYELGIRDSFDGKTILLCRKGQKLPFDLKDMRTVFYSKELVKESSKAIEKISTYLTNIDGSGKAILSPVQRVLGTRSESPTEVGTDLTKVDKGGVKTSARTVRLGKTLRFFLNKKGLIRRTAHALGDDWPKEFDYYAKRDSYKVGGWCSDHVTAVRTLGSLDTEFREATLDILQLVSTGLSSTTPSSLYVLLVVEQSTQVSSDTLEELAGIVEQNFTLLGPRSDAHMTLAKPKLLPNQANVIGLALSIELFDHVSASEFEAKLGIY